MKKQDFNAIILGGGNSSRTKLETKVPKQLLPIYNNKTLLQYQIEWLQSTGIEEVVLAIDSGTYDYIVEKIPYLLQMVDISVEVEKLGTGGAIRKAIDVVTSDKVYIMNVDDFVLSDFYTPDELIDTIGSGFSGAILTSRGKFPYGVIKSRGRRVTTFEQKPMMDFKVSMGHYAFTTGSIKSSFPDRGDFETSILPELAQDKLLTFMDLDGTWVTTNTWKELVNARKMIATHQSRKRYGNRTDQRGYHGFGRSR